MNTNLQQAVKPNLAVQQPVTTEYSIRVPKDNRKKHHVMRFNGNLKIDFREWKDKTVKIERENNLRSFKEFDEDMPKFGAGSEFGREAREEARRKKFGIASKQYKPDDQPWLLKVNGKNGRKFKGVREGGVSENAAYYIFTHGANGIIEAFPLKEWYNFQPVQRYKSLTAEEAEEEFSRRNKVMNYFSLMLKKRLRNDDDDGDDADLDKEKGKKLGKKNKDFKISEMDDWVDEDEENSDSDKDDSDADQSNKNKSNKKKKGVLKKKKKRASDSEAGEESDDGDEEGRECDYISDSSASDSELESQKEIKSVSEEDALRKLLASDDEEDDEDKKDEDDKNEDEDEDGKDKDEKIKEKSGKCKDKAKDKKKKDESDSSSEGDPGNAQNKNEKKPTSTQSSRSVTPTTAGPSTNESLKRPHSSTTAEVLSAKKVKLENNYVLPNHSNLSESRAITEDAVRRYLMRKPMTASELCQKFKKKSGLSFNDLVGTMTKILRNISPVKQKIKDKTYFSIKTDTKQPQQQFD